MVNRVNDWISSPPTYAGRETAWGASDIETGWASAAASRDWVNGYDSANNWRFLNFGDAGGCPPYGSCNNGWTQEDVWFVSYGSAPAWPLPEIYCLKCTGSSDTRGGNARQWQQISRYGYDAHGYRMNILGSMTQWYAAGGCCTNRPEDGWSQLQNAVNSDSATREAIEYSTDITWAN